MKATTLLIGLGIAAAIVQTTSPVHGGQEALGPSSVVLRPPSKGTVTFPHGRHQKVFVDCKPCHELFPKQAQGIEKMRAEGKLQPKEVMAMCQKCHQQRATKGEKTGPTACKDCHKE